MEIWRYQPFEDWIVVLTLIFGVSVVAFSGFFTPVFGQDFDNQEDYWKQISDGFWHMSNTSSAIFQLLIGGFAGLVIAVMINRRNSLKKEERGVEFTMALLEYLIPLRKYATDLRKDIEKNSEVKYRLLTKEDITAYEGLLQNVQEYHGKIERLLNTSGDSIDTVSQMILIRVIDDLELQVSFNTIDDPLYLLYRLESDLTGYLQHNKKMAKKSLDRRNARENKELLRMKYITKPTKGELRLQKIYEENIERNNEFLKDIISIE